MVVTRCIFRDHKLTSHKLLKISVTNLTVLRQAAGGSLPPHPAALSGPCWRSPARGSGRSHDPTPGEWSQRWLECPCPSVRSGAEQPGRPSVRRREEETGSRHPNARSKAGWTDRRARPAPAHGPTATLQYRRLRAEEKGHDMQSLCYSESWKDDVVKLQ